jgi:hypothetical protein
MTKNGLVVDVEGWFVMNARESRWKNEGPLGSYCNFEGKRRFPQLGINISVLEPGEAMGMYHREKAQEGFLALGGECLPDRRGAGASAESVGLLPLPWRHSVRFSVASTRDRSTALAERPIGEAQPGVEGSNMLRLVP